MLTPVPKKVDVSYGTDSNLAPMNLDSDLDTVVALFTDLVVFSKDEKFITLDPLIGNEIVA